MASLQSQLAFEASLDLETAQLVGDTPRGTRLIVYIKGGTFEGPKLRGEVLPGGGDWIRVRAGGVVRELNVRLTLRTHDDNLIYMSYRGIFKIRLELMQRMRGGDSVDPSEYYARTTVAFETASEKYGWLNDLVAVGVGTRTSTGLDYQVYAIL